ncbi:hypothetical protein [Bradyrhizobium sp. WSM2254]|uniref:hypothetical protein n=1 Tax=Bradyrhizobium sp. WSM2254 TaxID=1188263 RepID=UPI0004147E05|nr:hypothetical protein [Bradyrhizobium sp. WSM2254]
MNRKLDTEFLEDLQRGKLVELARKIRRDDTLMLALRGKSINVYYRGGSILRLEQKGTDYLAHFDANYAMDEIMPNVPRVVSAPEHCSDWVKALPQLKEFMNAFLSEHAKSEREFQQLVAWENNRSPISNSTEYFITDIEYADVSQSARLDMLGLRWLSHSRKDGSACTPVFIEMKYGIDAYDGDAGIIAHIDDLKAILGDPVRLEALSETIADQFNQLALLDLISFNRSKTIEKISVSGRPEVVFLLANHNPRSRKLLNILESVDEPRNFDLRFFTAAFAGYGMHRKCMMTLDQFRRQLEVAAATDTSN